MKFIAKQIILIVFLVCASTFAMAQPFDLIMSLDELYSLADARNKTIKIFETAVTGAVRDIDVAKNAYLPEVEFSASASYNGNAWVSSRDFSNGQTFVSPHFGNSFSLEATQTVFAGGAIHHQVEALKVQRQIAECELAGRRQNVYFLLTGYYLDLYKYRNLLTVYDRNLEQTRQVIDDMRSREAAGVALNNDITRYEVQYQNLEYKRTELLSSIDILNDKLVTLLQLPEQTEIRPDTTLLSLQVPRQGESVFRHLAFTNSPLLNKNRLNLNMLDRQKKVVKAAYYPQISIIAGDNLNGPITYEIPVLNNNLNVWYVGVGLKYNIGNLYKAPRKLSRLASTIQQSDFALHSSEEDVALEVRSAYIHYQDAFELLKTQEKSLQLARENYAVISQRYANDLVLVTDLVDADNLRLSAEVQYVNAQINIVYNYYKLLYATGSLHAVNH